jgi:integrase
MRYKEAFSVYRRKLASGKSIFYYQTYDEDGKRTAGHSTGMKTKTAAREYCVRLVRENRLLPSQQITIPTFAEFAGGWWDFSTCNYLKRKAGRRKMTRSYADGSKHKMNKHIIPAFGKTRLDKITGVEIDNWLMTFAEKGLKNVTANGYFIILKVMLEEAVRMKIIKTNPCGQIQKLMAEPVKIEILTPDEVKQIFPADWADVWNNKMFYTLNKLAACTGMRLGEIVGLRGEYVFDGYIKVCGQYNRYGFTDTKTHKERNIPIPALIRADLQEYIGMNGAGYVFSENGGETPIERRRVNRAFYNALNGIGITGEERERRHITFHGWRHFFNTTLRMANIADSKVQSITGHATQAMTELYTHFNTAELTEVRDVQDGLFLVGNAMEIPAEAPGA